MKPKQRLCPADCPHLERGFSEPPRCDLQQIQLVNGKWGGVNRITECTDEWFDLEPPPKGYIVCRGDECMNEDSGYFHGWTDIEPHEGYWEKVDPEGDFSPTHEGYCPECRDKAPKKQKEMFDQLESK